MVKVEFVGDDYYPTIFVGPLAARLIEDHRWMVRFAVFVDEDHYEQPELIFGCYSVPRSGRDSGRASMGIRIPGPIDFITAWRAMKLAYHFDKLSIGIQLLSNIWRLATRGLPHMKLLELYPLMETVGLTTHAKHFHLKIPNPVQITSVLKSHNLRIDRESIEKEIAAGLLSCNPLYIYRDINKETGEVEQKFIM